MTTRISENLKRLRRVKSLSQRDLAKKAGVAQSYISAIEHSKLVPSVKIIQKLATALGQNPEHLVRFHADAKSIDSFTRLVNADVQRPSYANVQDETDKAILKVIYALILGFVISAVCLILTIF